MAKIKIILACILFSVLFSGCNFIGNIFTYKETTKDFIESLINKDYDKSMSLMKPEFIASQNKDTLKVKLNAIRNLLTNNFGTKLDYTFESASKTVSTEKENSTPPGETLVLMQIANSKDFGEVRLLFDDKTKKIASFYVMQIKEPIPGMFGFWFFGVLVLGVLAFNIYAIVQVKRSPTQNKWLKYLAIILLNIPTIGYRPVSGLFFSLFNFQFMMGISFMYANYITSIVAFGIPIGSLAVLYKLKKERDQIMEDELLAFEQAHQVQQSSQQAPSDN